MIEFNEQTSGQTEKAIVVNVWNIQTFEPAGDELTAIVLNTGRTVIAALPYAELRRIVLEARSQFVTVLT